MRRQLFVAVLLSLVAAASASWATEEVKMDSLQVLVDFEASDDTRWAVVNDGVMGGLSQSSMKRTEDGTGVFSGDLSLENNGGFASVRALLGSRDLSPYSGLEIRVRGDGRSYQLRIRTDDRFDGIAYRAGFETKADEWITVAIPFEQFLPTFRGRVLEDVPALDASRAFQIALMVADKQPGPFALEVDFIAARK